MAETEGNPPRDGEGDHAQHGGGGPVPGAAPPPSALRAATSPSRGRSQAYLAALAIFVVDQLSKWIVIGPLSLQQRGQIELLPIFNLTWVENRGISLGLLTADGEVGRWMLVVLTAAIAIGVAYWIRREEARGDQFALSLVLGGALGNIVDRVRLGYVVDFADLHFGAVRPFLVFNVADAAISIGVVILLVRAFILSRKSKSESPDHA